MLWLAKICKPAAWK
jgi:hypothetical protein